MKKNNTAEKTVLEAEELSQALKEGTQQSLKNIVNEAINKMITESDEDEYEEEDVDADTDTDADDTSYDDSEDVKDPEEDDDEWSDMEQYKVGDNDYDFTDADGDEILKVYNKLGDDDQIVVRKNDEGDYEIKDNETGAEYVIELNDADIDSHDDDTDVDIELDDDDDFNDEDDDADVDIELDDEDDGFDDEDDDADVDIELDDEDDDFDDDDDDADVDIELDDEDDFDDDDDTEFEIDDDDDTEKGMVNETNLGYTDSYQKDVMPGLSMKEPANPKATYSMDGGAPEGTSRPYSGYKNKESNLFTKKTGTDLAEGMDDDYENMDDQEEANMAENSTGHNAHHSMRKGFGRAAQSNNPGTKRLHSDGGEYKEGLSENYVRRIVNKANQIQCENKKYASALSNIKSSLKEAAVLNVSLAQIVKLLSENTTNAYEKKSIVERFNKVKTIKESKALYDTIKNELNSNNNSTVMLERQMSVNGSNVLNETKMYQNKSANPSIALMERMDNLYK